MIQKLKGKLGKTIFTYWVFWAFILIPIILSLILMCAIATGDALEFTKITKASLDTFIKYQKVPLVILGLSIPFGTLAAANFRAKQFHRNLERQEYEHQIDLYHKELSFFEKKFEGALLPKRMTYVAKHHAALLFSKSREFPEKGTLFDPSPVTKNGVYIASLINPALQYLYNIHTQNDENHLATVDSELFKKFFVHLDQYPPESHIDLELLTFMTKFHVMINKVSNHIGIDKPRINDTFIEYVRFYREAIEVLATVYQLNMFKDFPLANDVFTLVPEIADRSDNFDRNTLTIRFIADHYMLNYKFDDW